MAGPASIERLDYFMRAVFNELKRVGGSAKIRDILAAVKPKLKLTDYEQSHNDSGTPRWETNVRFHLTDCVRAG
jgi:hypothetical protein